MLDLLTSETIAVSDEELEKDELTEEEKLETLHYMVSSDFNDSAFKILSSSESCFVIVFFFD